MGEVTNDRVARFVAKIDAERETLDEMAQRIVEGESLAELCKAWDVPFSRFMAWLTSDTGRWAQYCAALAVRADTFVAEAVKIADDDAPRIVEHTMKDGTVVPVVIPPEHQRAKIKIDARFRTAAKWDPQRFGEAEYVPPARKPIGEVPMLEAARRVAFALAKGARIVEREKRAPRLLEGTSTPEPQGTEGEI